MQNISKSKISFVDMFVVGMVVATQIYMIVYFRKQIQKEKEAPSKDEFENFVDDLKEVKYNVQKSLGRKYIKT
jgi:hypothetical protein